MKLTRNYVLLSFACHTGNENLVEPPVEYRANALYLAKQLEVIRAKLGYCSVHIKEAWLTKLENEKRGYYPKNPQLHCRAVRISAQKYTVKELYGKISFLANNGDIPKGQIILGPTTVYYCPDFSVEYSDPEFNQYF